MSLFEPPVLGEFSPNDEPKSSTSFLIHFCIFASVFAVGVIFYDILRLIAPGHCYYREKAAQYRSDDSYDGTPLQSPPRPRRYPLAWVWSTLKYPFDDLVVTHGLDVAMFISFLQTQTRVFFILAVFTCLTLVPLYVTSDSSLIDQNLKPTDLEMASLANIPDKSIRLWGTLLAEVVVTTVVLVLLFWDLQEYTKQRILYRNQSENNPSNFAVLVMDIPKKDRCESRVFNFFNAAFPGQVAAVNMVRDAGKLLAMKTNLIFLLNRQRLHGRGDQDVDESDIEDSEPEPISVAPLALQYSIDHDVFSAYFDDTASNAYINQLTVENAGRVQDSSPVLLNSTHRNSSQTDGRRSGRIMRTRSRNRTTEQMEINRKIEIAKGVIQEKETSLDEDTSVSHAAVVIFRTQAATTFASSAPIFSNADQWVVSRAPNPRAMNWNRVFITRYTTRVRKYVSFATLTAMTILWAVPSFFIQVLGDLKDFGKILDGVNSSGVSQFVSEYPEFSQFLMTFVPPVLLFMVLLAAPQIFRLVIQLERLPSQVHVEDKVSDFLFFFFVMSNFVYQVSVQSVLLLLVKLEDIPDGVLEILSTAVPKKATFLMQYVVINSFMGNVAALINTGRLVFRPLVKLRAKTDRDNMMANRVFADFPFAKMYALCLMISLIALVYSTIAPIFNVVSFLYFGLGYLCTKQVLLYSHRPMFEGGGYLYRHAWTGVLIGLLVHQVIIVTIFFLKKAVYQGVFSCLFLIVSVVFYFETRQMFASRIEDGSILSQTEVDSHMDGSVIHEVSSRFIGMYIHPGLRSLESLMQAGTRRQSDVNTRPGSGSQCC